MRVIALGRNVMYSYLNSIVLFFQCGGTLFTLFALFGVKVTQCFRQTTTFFFRMLFLGLDVELSATWHPRSAVGHLRAHCFEIQLSQLAF
jgi:hypothetical protein